MHTDRNIHFAPLSVIPGSPGNFQDGSEKKNGLL